MFSSQKEATNSGHRSCVFVSGFSVICQPQNPALFLIHVNCLALSM